MAEARIDKWMWAVRIFKTRTIAAEACKKGRVTINGALVKAARMVKPGDVIEMKAGCRHTIIADTELKVIEVQIGKDISVLDKIKY